MVEESDKRVYVFHGVRLRASAESKGDQVVDWSAAVPHELRVHLRSSTKIRGVFIGHATKALRHGAAEGSASRRGRPRSL